MAGVSDQQDLQKLKVIELKEMLKESGLDVKGTKAELIDRLSNTDAMNTEEELTSLEKNELETETQAAQVSSEQAGAVVGKTTEEAQNDTNADPPGDADPAASTGDATADPPASADSAAAAAPDAIAEADIRTPKDTLFVCGFGKGAFITEKGVRDVFEAVGEVKEVRLFDAEAEKYSGSVPPGCAILTMGSVDLAASAMEQLNGKAVHGFPKSKLRVRYNSTIANPPPDAKVFVVRLPKGFTEEQVRDLFKEYGTIRAVQLLGISMKRNLGDRAIVEFATSKEAESALELNGTITMEGCTKPIGVEWTGTYLQWLKKQGRFARKEEPESAKRKAPTESEGEDDNTSDAEDNAERIPKNKIFVSGFGKTAVLTDRIVRSIFRAVGEVKGVQLYNPHASKITGSMVPQGCAIVTMASVKLAARAIEVFNGKVAKGYPKSKLRVRFECDGTNMPACTNLYVVRLAKDATDDQIKELFKDCGIVQSVRYLGPNKKDPSHGEQRAIVEFTGVQGAEKAVLLAGKVKMEGCSEPIGVEWTGSHLKKQEDNADQDPAQKKHKFDTSGRWGGRSPNFQIGGGHVLGTGTMAPGFGGGVLSPITGLNPIIQQQVMRQQMMQQHMVMQQQQMQLMQLQKQAQMLQAQKQAQVQAQAQQLLEQQRQEQQRQEQQRQEQLRQEQLRQEQLMQQKQEQFMQQQKQQQLLQEQQRQRLQEQQQEQMLEQMQEQLQKNQMMQQQHQARQMMQNPNLPMQQSFQQPFIQNNPYGTVSHDSSGSGMNYGQVSMPSTLNYGPMDFSLPGTQQQNNGFQGQNIPGLPPSASIGNQFAHLYQ